MVRLSPETNSMLEELASDSNMIISDYVRALIKSLYVAKQTVENPDGSYTCNLWEGTRVTIPKEEVEQMMRGLEDTFKKVNLDAIKIEEKKPKIAQKGKVAAKKKVA